MSSKVSRRKFVKSTVAGGVAGAVLGAVSGIGAATLAPTGKTGPPLPSTWKYETDVLIAGAGAGGLTAALRAGQQGVKVILIEASRRTGGTGQISGGFFDGYNMATWDEFKKTMPTADPVLGKLFADTWPETSKWVQGLGVPFKPEMLYVGPGQTWKGLDIHMGPGSPGGQVPNDRAYYDGFEKLIKAAGVTILTQTRAVKLWQDFSGRIIGLRAVVPEGTIDIRAKATILAVGGFQANKELLVRYFGEWADLAVCRAIPYNTGTGLMMGLEVGAMLSRGMVKAYGYTQLYPTIVPQTPEEWEKADLSLVRSLMGHLPDTAGIYVNLEGKRYVDENITNSNPSRLMLEFLKQPLARGFCIFDQAQAVSVKTFIDLIKNNGGVVITADTIDGLIEALSNQFSVRKVTLTKTIDEYNKAVSSGSEAAMNLEVPRSGDLNTISKPPFYCIPVTAGISMNYGGLAINASCQVLDTVQQPILGLYAIPGTAQSPMYEGDWDTLGVITTFGYIAGKTVADFVKTMSK